MATQQETQPQARQPGAPQSQPVLSREQIATAINAARRRAEEAEAVAQQAVAQQNQRALQVQQLQETIRHLQAANAVGAASVAASTVDGTTARAQEHTWDIIDNKLLSKPQMFKGQEKEWPMWSFKLLAYIASLGEELYAEMAVDGALRGRNSERRRCGTFADTCKWLAAAISHVGVSP